MNQNSKIYTIQGNQLKIGDSLLEFKFPIKQSLEISDMLILRLDVPTEIVYNENVFGVNFTEEKVKWQIGKKNYKTDIKNCPFVEIRFSKNQLILHNWCDTYLVADPLTGKILEEGWTK